MKTFKYLFTFTAIMAMLLGAGFSTPTASAQEGALDPNTPVSDTDGEMAVAENAKSGSLQPKRGSVKLAPEKIPAKYLDLPEKLAPGQEASAESVLGADGRVKVSSTTSYPYRAIAYISMKFGSSTYRCTGWFVSSRLVMTAGHCVYEPASQGGRGWATNVVVYPGKNGSVAPYGSRAKHRLFTVSGWTNSGNSGYDYGAIQIGGTAFGSYFGAQKATSYPGTFTVSGYPGDKDGYFQWKMSGGVSSFTANSIFYKMDTYGGQSGAPLYRTVNSVCCYGVGVHAYGGTTNNSATRINTSVYNNIVTWKNKPYP